ncbi:MAG: hypothetical protein LBR36_09105 [Bacteroidales bacterium]|jgi:hypothetical protein|nr:hypothetical protein [Bacteroidales bacterium]
MIKTGINLRKLILLVLLTTVCVGFVQAQKSKKNDTSVATKTYLREDQIPENVMKMFKKKFSSATEQQWEFVKSDGIYRISCSLRDVASVIDLDTMGVWKRTLEKLPNERFMSSQAKSVNEFFPNFKLESLQRETRSDKNDQFIVTIYEQQNIKNKQITRVYLDKTGKVIRTEQTNETTKNTKNAKKEEQEDKKIEKAFENSRSMEIYPTKLREDELPAAIQRWVAKNYPDYIYKQIDYDEYDEFEQEGSVYQIVIQRNGVNQPHATVWFTRDGKFLKVDDPYKVVEQSEEVEQKEEIKPAYRPKSVVWEDSVKTVFDSLLKSRYPRAKDADWMYDEEQNYVATFTDAKGENTVTYTQNAEWKETVIKLAKIESIPSSIRTYIENNYPKSTVNEGSIIYQPGQKPYYSVEFYNKKAKSNETMEFLSNGKPKE